MMNHCKNTISIIYLLFCLFITSASARSYIRQFTDAGNTNLHQDNGEVLNLNVDKVSVPNMVKGFRTRPPSTYSLKIESFDTLLNSPAVGRYETRPFSAVGYNWTLVVYPNGNGRDGGADHLSLYVAIDNSPLVASPQDVDVDLRFYIFNKKEKKYLTIEDTDLWRFNVFKTMWGFPKALPLSVFTNKTQGYLYDGDHCEFGVDVTLPPLFKNSELFSVAQINGKYTWSLRGFSKMVKNIYYTDVFSIGGKNWYLQVFPGGYSSAKGKALSMFLYLDEKKIPNEKYYVRAKFRVLNQRQLGNTEKQFGAWYSGSANGYGVRELISFSDLRDSSKGFVVNDDLILQVEIEVISSTKFLP